MIDECYPGDELLLVFEEPHGALVESWMSLHLRLLQHHGGEERHHAHHGADLEGNAEVVATDMVVEKPILLTPKALA
jgi:hypothetical protein